jgi:carboxyl-terminal processing protease
MLTPHFTYTSNASAPANFHRARTLRLNTLNPVLSILIINSDCCIHESLKRPPTEVLVPKRFLCLSVVAAALTCLPIGGTAPPQKMDSFDIARSRGILHDAYDLVKKHYYDPALHGLDWDARFHDYDEKIKSAPTIGQAFGVVAGFLDGLKDSHVFFSPPARTNRVDYGYRMQLFGDNAFVTRIRPGTDAETKLHLGDQVAKFNGFEVNHADFEQITYYFWTLAPQGGSRLVLRDPAGKQREVLVEAKTRQLKSVLDITGTAGDNDIWQLIREAENSDHIVRQRYVEMGDVMIWKMPEFELGDAEVDHLIGIARKHKTLILDLRGNPGGYIDTLARMVGSVLDHDMKIAERKGRKDLKPQIAKSRGGSAFSGKLIVLVDSSSASAAELFARVVQLEHRGSVLGDHSSGSVMEARYYPCSQGADTKLFYGFSIIDADLIMSDGKSLEHTGVIPDELLLPTAQDLASGSDPVLARAAQLAGVTLEPAAAGKLFPFEWLPL